VRLVSLKVDDEDYTMAQLFAGATGVETHDVIRHLFKLGLQTQRWQLYEALKPQGEPLTLTKATNEAYEESLHREQIAEAGERLAKVLADKVRPG
jgi:hypothetical protein